MATYVPVGDIKTHRLTKNLLWVTKMIDVDRQTGAGSDGQIDQNDVLACIPVIVGLVLILGGRNKFSAGMHVNLFL